MPILALSFCRMNRTRSIPFLFFLLLPLSLSGQQPGEVNWREEIDLLGRELSRRHPDLFFQTDSTHFYRALANVADHAGGKTPLGIAVELQKVLAGMGDAHTRVNYHYYIRKEYILPVECYWFQEGIHVLRAREGYEHLLGKRITAINGTPVEQVIDSLATLITRRNPSLVMHHVPAMITWAELLEHFGFCRSDRLEISLADMQGNTSSIEISLPARKSEMMAVKTDSLPMGWVDRKSLFREVYLPDERLYYIQYNKCWSREAEKLFGSGASALFLPSFREFEKEVVHTIRKEEVERLVFDLRFNGGGNSVQGTRFIRKIKRTGIGTRARVYLIVGRGTFSSAIINAVEIMEAFDVLVLGENTGGKPNHFGEVRRFVLPESKMVVSHATKYFTLMDDDPPAIIPDIHTPDTFVSFMKGIDPSLEAAREH